MNRSSRAQGRRKKRWAVVRVIGLTVLGALIGMGVSTLVGAATGERWQRLAVDPPRGTSELFIDPDRSLCAKTRDNRIAKYDPDRKAWDETDCVESRQDQSGRRYRYANPCQREWPEFSFLTNAPRTIEHCVSYSWVYMDGGGAVVYALDADGQVWSRSQTRTPQDVYRGALRLLLFTVGGGILGLVIGIVRARS